MGRGASPSADDGVAVAGPAGAGGSARSGLEVWPDPPTVGVNITARGFVKESLTTASASLGHCNPYCG